MSQEEINTLALNLADSLQEKFLLDDYVFDVILDTLNDRLAHINTGYRNYN